MIRFALMTTAACGLCGCTQTQTRNTALDEMEAVMVNGVLTSWHLAADQGLYEFYFDQMTDDAIFLGTDATERWTKEEFMGYAREPFSDGNGWTYTQDEWHIAFDEDRNTAWGDEILRNEKYGILRGTSVLRKVNDRWKIAHYSLTFLVPNEKAGDVVEIIAD
jgi:ketosteroid isomerase-like protein